jgi:serine/threonine-protein kinase
MPSFQISDAPSRLELGKPGADGAIPPGKAGFTVRNMGPRAQTGRIRIEPMSGADPAWFALAGAPDTSPAEIEKEFDFSGNAAVEAIVRPQAGAKAGSYAFQLKVTAEQDPDTDFVLGPAVAFDIAAPEKAPEPGKKFPWWIVAVAAVLVLAIVGGGAAWYFWPRPDRIEMPDLAGQPAELAAMQIATLGHGVTFATDRVPGAQSLAVLRTDPEAEGSLEKSAVAALMIQAPSGACGSLVCMFPGATFPPDVIATLVAEGFDPKYAPALSEEGGIIVLDPAQLAEIKNAAPPAPIVTVPNLVGVHIGDAAGILAGLGLGAEFTAVATGSADNRIQRTNPGAGGRVEAGTNIGIVYRPEEVVGPRPCRFCDVIQPDIRILEEPVILSPDILRMIQVQ